MRRLRHDLMAPMSFEDRSAKLQKKTADLLGQDRGEMLWKAAQGEDLRALCDQLVMS